VNPKRKINNGASCARIACKDSENRTSVFKVLIVRLHALRPNKPNIFWLTLLAIFRKNRDDFLVSCFLCFYRQILKFEKTGLHFAQYKPASETRQWQIFLGKRHPLLKGIPYTYGRDNL